MEEKDLIEKEEIKEEMEENIVENNEDFPSNKEKDIQQEYDKLVSKNEEIFNQLQRTMAEFDNFKKRTIKEKENLYIDSAKDILSEFLPVLDNLERAVSVSKKDQVVNNSLQEGVELVLKQFYDVLIKMGIEKIEAVGNSFDPEMHNAVMHVEDEQFGQNEVIEEFQKGYLYKGKVIRYSMVKVAN